MQTILACVAFVSLSLVSAEKGRVEVGQLSLLASVSIAAVTVQHLFRQSDTMILVFIQVYGFSVARSPTYRGYDWSILTTSAWRTDPELIDLANQHNAKVEINAGNVADVMSDAARRTAWVGKMPAVISMCLSSNLPTASGWQHSAELLVHHARV